METTISRGVKWHHPAQVASVVTDPNTNAVTGVHVLNSETQTESVISCRNIIITAGPWTPHVFKTLFPSAKLRLNVSALGGYSLVLRSPRHTQRHERETHQGRSHAVFTTHPRASGFSPELFSREGAEIYIAGLNSSQIPLPTRADGIKAIMDEEQIDALKTVAVRLLGKLADGHVESSDELPNADDLEVLREGLCFRPVTTTGRPIVSRVSERHLGVNVQSGTSAVGREIGGVFVATGHGPWGISQSLGTGRVVADMVDGIKTSADVSGLRM
jgi:glycine/D-amino acid oxidase-like deaminating enzyme